MIAILKPVVETGPRVEPSGQVESLYLRSYLLMRAMVGALGMALPLSLVFVDRLFFTGKPFPRDSLSAYYYSGMRELFVGTLFAIAIFLVTYKVMEVNLDNTLSIFAGIAAVGVALFPTGRPTKALAFSPLQDRLGEGLVQQVHFGSAVAFIGSLAVLCFYFGLREGRRPARAKRRSPTFWRWWHWVCAGVIAGSLLFMFVAKLSGQPSKALLMGETISVWAFGTSWLMKGLEIDMFFGHNPPWIIAKLTRNYLTTAPSTPGGAGPVGI